ncbi:MAG: YczE/YyaS/YitT family protein [Candidatus Nanopelagicales bacterium]
MTLAEPIPVVPLRNPRAWASLVIGVALVGIGLGFMIDADFGVAPADALFTALSRASGLTVGTILVLASILMVLMSWALGLRPAIGTLVSFVGIAVVVDLTRLLLGLVDAPEWSLAARIGLWIVGLLFFCSGVMGIFASDLGASPYDQVVRSIAYRTGRSLGASRLMVDVIAMLGAIVLGGSWGIGTVIILVAVPLALTLVLPRVRARVYASPRILTG